MKKRYWALVLGAMAILVVKGTAFVNEVSRNNSSPTSTQPIITSSDSSSSKPCTDISSNSTSSSNSKPSIYQLGQRFKVDNDYTATVDRIWTTNAFPGHIAKGTFCVVQIELTNISWTPILIDPEMFIIADADGNQYSADVQATLDANGLSKDGFMPTLKPDEIKVVGIAFDVPSYIQEGLQLQTTDGTVTVKLND